jgi:capsule polysaccharide export protein KpsE/RkpR
MSRDIGTYDPIRNVVVTSDLAVSEEKIDVERFKQELGLEGDFLMGTSEEIEGQLHYWNETVLVAIQFDEAGRGEPVKLPLRAVWDAWNKALKEKKQP